MPSCAIEDIVRIMPLVEPRTQKQLSQIVLATQKLTKPMVVEYVASSVDGQGRVYARQVGAQQLPRDVRALVYGRTHKVSPQRRTIFPHLNCKKWSEPDVFCTFSLGNVLLATAARNF